jgi:hypothetical protein
MNSVLDATDPFDGDMAARMLRLEETGQPHPEATWKSLTRAERKRARSLWEWARDTSLEPGRRGRPQEMDSALVLYCSRVLAEECEKPKFKFSRPVDGGNPRGPMWRVLTAALPLAESYLALMNGEDFTPRNIEHHAETIAEIVTVSRTEEFEAQCLALGLQLTPSDIAQHPGTYRYAMMLVRSPNPPPSRRG